MRRVDLFGVDWQILQAAMAAPIVFSLAVFSAMHQGRSGLHRLIAAVLGLIFVWMVGWTLMAAAPPGPWKALGRVLLGPPSCALAPLYFLAMTRYGSLRFFENNRAADFAVLSPFALFYLARLTNASHGLVSEPGSDPFSANPQQWAGPIWWALQACSYAAVLGGLLITLRLALRGETTEDRRRASLLMAAVVCPMVAHTGYVFEFIPTPVPLTPSALAVSALCLAAAIQRYQLLETRPLARRDVIEALGDGVILADADRRTVDVNPAAAAILGRARDTLFAVDLCDALEGILDAGAERHLASMIEEAPTSPSHLELQVRAEGGRFLDVSVGTTGTRESGQGWFVVIRDRTRERVTEQQLHQSQRLESVGVLAAGVAHEVNNPLAFVRSNLEYLATTIDELKTCAHELPEALRGEIAECGDVLAESSAGIERIASIVDGLLRFSRASTNERESTDVNGLVDEALRLASLQAARDIEVKANLADGLPLLELSSGRLVQVLLNLLLNAKQALRDRGQGRVEVATERCGDWVEIRVRDDGPGIPPEVVGRIFDPFFTTRDPGEGTGLGLSIAYDIVREHSGQIRVESQPGEGACFLLRLPIPSDVLSAEREAAA